MSAYKANRLHVAWIQLLTGLYTIWYSLRIIFVAYSSGDKREKVTQLTRKWARRVLGPTGLVTHVRGAENLIKGNATPTIVMCSHTSLYDVPVSFLALDSHIRMLAKKELYSIPILSSALRAGDFVAIDRRNIEQAKLDLKLAQEKLNSGIVVWIAPEGTRSKDGRLRPFKKGGFHLAIDTKANIVPVVIKGIQDILPSNSYDLTIHGEVEVVIGKAIDASEYDKTNCNQLRDKTRNTMLALLEEV